jgi:dihydroorotase
MAEMSLLLRNCYILDPQSSFHKKKTSILIQDGRIVSTSSAPQEGDRVRKPKEVDLGGKIVSPGWFDLRAHFNDPGLEHKEDLRSGGRVALAGGFTDVALLPNTHPVLDTKSDIEYIKSKSGAPGLHPIAALSKGTEGESLSEILDLRDAGAVAFSDGLKPTWNSELLLKALQYTQKFNGLVMSFPRNVHLSRHAQMHEGVEASRLGMKGEPSLSEKIQIAHEMDILRYAGGRLHFSCVSSEEGLAEIRHAKKEGLQVTCDVALHHLIFTDKNLREFDTVFKSEPPFRTERDRKALIKGLKDGTIDAIMSAHLPQDTESKQLEFDLAEAGALSLQTAFACLLKLEEELPLEISFAKMCAGRTLLGFEPVSIKKGSAARLSIFDPKAKWTLNDKTNVSKSRNSPFWNMELVGKATGVVIDGEIHLQP